MGAGLSSLHLWVCGCVFAGETPMTCAAYYGHTDVIKELIENGADVNLVSMGRKHPSLC